ncbi:MAG: ABC transporter ATP-binding protein/permease [Defluviitaleaceae bacterium]|nr:ABC transporter ATP-binding protein/permease [Defluviitaleaceae bacterium]
MPKLSTRINQILRPLFAFRYGAITLKAINILVSLLPPYLISMLADDLNTTGGENALHLIAITVGVLVVYFFLDWTQDFFWYKMLYTGAGMVRSYLFSNVLHKDYRFFMEHSVGDIENKVIHDAEYYAKAKLSMMPMLCLNILHIVIILAFLTSMHMEKTFVVVGLCGLFYLIYARINKLLRKTSKHEREGFSELLNTANETLMGINTIQLYNAESYFDKHFEHAVEKYEGFLIRLRKWQALAYSATDSIMSIIPVIAVLIGIGLATTGYITMGGIVAFFLFLPRLSYPIKSLADFNISLQTARAVEGRLEELLDTSHDDNNYSNLEEVKKIQSLEFVDISYSYDGNDEHEVLTDVCFDISEGDALAIIGPSGTGKTTFLRLLKRQLVPTLGKVLVNGKDREGFNPESYLERVAVLSQEVFAFDASIRENIRFGKDIPSERIDALAKFCALGDINLDDNAKNLSGGERQRMGLARALACDYDILVLDEPTSDLDLATEAQIVENLKTLLKQKGKILIVVTHSDYVLKNLCNKVLPLSKIYPHSHIPH